MNDNSCNTSGAVTPQDYRLQEEIVFDGNTVRSVTDSSQIAPLSYVSAQQTTAELKSDQHTEQIVSVFDAAMYNYEVTQASLLLSGLESCLGG